MKILLTAINAKYIHTCPAIYSLKAYADEQGVGEKVTISTAEYTINDRYNDILDSVLSHEADVIAFSTYIWNVDRVRRLIRDLRKILADQVQLWAGGPEATYYPAPFLLEDGADLCMLGEGEETFTSLVRYVATLPSVNRESTEVQNNADLFLSGLSHIQGIACRKDDRVVNTRMAVPVNLNQIPFLYRDLSAYEHRILYYESSRGCPFSCAYCLSGKERGIRFRDLTRVKEELQFFLDQKVPQVKFIDRTFNADPDRAIQIWEYLREHDNGVTNFHFEIEADRITREELELLTTLRPGLIQMEIGVQSANPATLKSVHRSAKLDRIREVMDILTREQNINLHLDLIAGLPFEDLESFAKSFQAVYEMRPHQFQIGFLKLLKGTELYERREEYGLVCSEDAPYEVLKTRWLSYSDISRLHRISDRVEEYVNSQGFRRSLPLAEKMFPDAFSLFESLAAYYREKGYEQKPPSVFRRYEIFSDFLRERAVKTGAVDSDEFALLLETVRFDQYLHTHPSRRMSARETFFFGGFKEEYFFDYQETSPVHGEARAESWGRFY